MAVVPGEGESLQALADRYQYEVSELMAVARAISSERDVVKLLGVILEKARWVTGADAGSVYIVEGQGAAARKLRFMVSQNDSVAIDYRQYTLPVDDRSVVGAAVIGRSPINVRDLYAMDPSEGKAGSVRHFRDFDLRSGYRTRSMLTVPMMNQHEEVIGVIQLINRKRDPKAILGSDEDHRQQVIAFDRRAEELAAAVAAQAGISLENALLYQEIRQLFEGFVSASVTAIESRDPTTSGHSQRVAALTCGLAEVVDREGAGPYASLHFTADAMKCLEYASLLHDFGKVGVREKVLVKAKKLHESERNLLLARFDYIRKALETDHLKRQLERVLAVGSEAAAAELKRADADLREELGRLDESMAFVLRANEPTVLAEGSFERLAEIAGCLYSDPNGERKPYLTEAEVEALQVPRGSLTPAERVEIERHVVNTHQFLSAIPWGRKLREIPEIARAHHEKLDGSGYPRGLRGNAIPIESRMMTVADIFDALTAADRPYKRAVPVERALDILGDEVARGLCDAELFRLFVDAKLWTKVMLG